MATARQIAAARANGKKARGSHFHVKRTAKRATSHRSKSRN